MAEQPAPRLSDALRRYGVSSLVIVLLAVLVSVGVALLISPHAVARATLSLKAPDDVGLTGADVTSESGFVRYVKQRALFLTSDRVLDDVKSRPHDPTPLPELRDRITAAAAPSGEAITVTVTAGSRSRATRLAESVVRAYRKESRADIAAAERRSLTALSAQRRRLIDRASDSDDTGSDDTGSDEPGGDATREALGDIDKQVAAVRVAADQLGDGVAFAGVTTPSGSALTGPALRAGAIGLVAGLLLACLVAWVRADRHRRVDGPGDLAGLGEGADVPDPPVLGEVPLAQAVTPLEAPAREYQLALGVLRSAMASGVVVVGGAGRGCGSAVPAVQLAWAAARDGARVLLVDTVPASERVPELLRLAAGDPGFAGVAAGSRPLADAAREVRFGDGACCRVLPAGSAADPPPSAAAVKAVSEMRAQYDLVVLVAGPVGTVRESGALIGEADGVVLVVRSGTALAEVRQSTQRVRLLGGTMAGFLLASPRGARPA